MMLRKSFGNDNSTKMHQRKFYSQHFNAISTGLNAKHWLKNTNEYAFILSVHLALFDRKLFFSLSSSNDKSHVSSIHS
jgi:hypothetical protein